MTTSIDFDHLSPPQFESLCFDLLSALGPESIQWRKGSPTDSSPSDQGRDIECVFRYTVPGGESFSERRFVECKHHKKGVPPRELDGALAWASAERPNALYFLISGFLSNPAKEYIAAYERNNRPPFQIVVWERPQIIKHLGRNSRLLRKYGLAGSAPHMDLLHPAHVTWIAESPLFGLDELFHVLDTLKPKERDDYLSWAFYMIVDRPMRLPDIGKKSLADVLGPTPTYEEFRAKCYSVPVEDFFIASAVVGFCLSSLFHLADLTRADEIRERIQRFIRYCEDRLGKGEEQEDSLRTMIHRNREDLATLDERLNENYARYESFCEKVLVPIMELPWPRLSIQ